MPSVTHINIFMYDIYVIKIEIFRTISIHGLTEKRLILISKS